MGNTPGQLHRLTKIDTQEVSVVDAAANNRKLLIVKAKENNVGARAGVEVVQTETGGHTAAVNKDQGKETKLKLSATTKASLSKSLADALNTITALKAQVEGSEAATTDDVPEEVSKALAPVADQLFEVAKAHVTKAGRPQFSQARLQQLEGVRATLDELLTGVTPAPAPAPAPAAQAAPVVDAAAIAAEVTKSIKATNQKLEGDVTEALQAVSKSIEKITAAVNTQAGQMAEIQKNRSSTNAPSEPATGVRKEKKKLKKNSWPSDIAAERRAAMKKQNKKKS